MAHRSVKYQIIFLKRPFKVEERAKVLHQRGHASHSHVFIFHSLSAGLAVDYFNERLYWADAKLSVIGSVRLDGSDPVVAVSGIKNS